MTMMKLPPIDRRTLATLLGATVLSACTLGPDFRRPDIATPAAFKENQGWTVAAPADDDLRHDEGRTGR